MNAYSSSQVVFNIRGVSQNDYGDQQEPPVAVYQDDSYSSSINLASFPVFDLARVEVLRGPQGTLFGRNATGGAIQFVSNRPTKDFEGYAHRRPTAATTSSSSKARSPGRSDRQRCRDASRRSATQDDGYMESVVPGVDDRGGNDHYALRGQLAWQPSDATDLNLIVRYMKADGETQAGIYSHEPACPNDQFQGEFTRPDQSCAFWGSRARARRAPATATTRSPRAAAATRGRPPRRRSRTSTARSPAPRCTSTGTSATLDLVSITDYQDAEQVLPRGRRRRPGRRRAVLPGQRPRAVLAGVPPGRRDGRAHLGGGPLRHERRRRLHRQVRHAVLRLRPDRSRCRRRRPRGRSSRRTSGRSPTTGS